MSNAIYASLTRQTGLTREMETIANNIANASTTGYKADRAIFVEYLSRIGNSSAALSAGGLGAHAFSMEPGDLRTTGSPLDLALNGDGFFLVEAAGGARLTRAGSFHVSEGGVLADRSGNAVLSADGARIVVPGSASQISISPSGVLLADNEPIDLIGVVQPKGELRRDGPSYFDAPEGYTVIDRAKVVSGALEQSNVSPVLEVARMIEVHRAYEAGQSLMDRENERISQLIQAVRDR